LEEETKAKQQEENKAKQTQMNTLNVLKAMANNRVNRELSPVPFDRYENIQHNLLDGEYAVIHQAPPHNALVPYQPQRHYLRNALMLAGLGAGIGAAYRYRQPLLKLGQKAYNNALDKFHNLFPNSSNSTALVERNPHNW